MHPKVSEFVEQARFWPEVLSALRAILQSSPLEEDFKWKAPCYTIDGKNIVILYEFKGHCGLSFFKGALLKDAAGLLEMPGPNSHSGRLMSFTDIAHVKALEPAIRLYLEEAIAIERSGQQVQYPGSGDLPVPEELIAAFARAPEFESAFHSLTPGRQKGYLLFFAGGRQAKTRASRIEKYRSRIMQGKGMQDCICGLSQKMPRCDGSHKQAPGRG